MNKILNLIIIVGILAIVLVLAFWGYNTLSKGRTPDNLATMPSHTAPTGTQPSGQTQSAEPETMPDFTVYDLDGKPHKLSDFRGKPVVLNFWASWCSPCKSEMPDFDAAYQEYGQDIHFVMVNLTDGYQETVDTASAFITQSGYRFPVYYDTDMDAAQVYGVNSVPITFFIDAEGYGVAYAQGALSADALAQGIGMLTE